MPEPAAHPSEPTAERTGTKVRSSEIQNLLADLAAGAEYQKALLPKAAPPIAGYDLAHVFRAARQISGDFFDFIPLDSGRYGIVIADASGKGIPASLLTMSCRTLFRIQPEPEAPPARVLGHVNRMLAGNIKRGMFVSAIYAVLDLGQHTLVLANGGHLPTVVWRSKPRVATVHPSKSPVLGILSPEAYEAQAHEESISLGPGDRFVFLTDGVNEAMAPGQKEFGMEHLRRRLQSESDRPSEDFLRHIMEQIDLHRGGGEQSDDITLVTGRRLP